MGKSAEGGGCPASRHAGDTFISISLRPLFSVAGGGDPRVADLLKSLSATLPPPPLRGRVRLTPKQMAGGAAAERLAAVSPLPRAMAATAIS